jgi:hypothetical protein
MVTTFPDTDRCCDTYCSSADRVRELDRARKQSAPARRRFQRANLFGKSPLAWGLTKAASEATANCLIGEVIVL